MVSGISTRERILETAGRLFAERGRQATTVRDIVREAGVNQAAINYHFRDKDNLYFEVLEHGARAAFDRFPADGGVGCDQPPELRLQGVIQACLGRGLSADRNSWHGRLMVREMEDPSPDFLRLVDRIIGEMMPLLEDIVGSLNPRLEEQQRWLCCHSLMSLCHGLCKGDVFLARTRPQWQELSDPQRLDLLAQHLYRFCLVAIGGMQ